MTLAIRFTRGAVLASCSALLAGCAGPRDVAPPAEEPAVLVPASAATHAEPSTPHSNIREEHALTTRIAFAAEEEAELVKSGVVRRGRIAKMLEFFVNFTDRCHHSKEERYLFPLIREVAPALGGKVALLERDHALNKQRLMELERLVDEPLLGPIQREKLGAQLAEYAIALRGHIARESRLFARVRPELDAEQNARLGRGFEQIERDELEPGFHEKYHALAVSIIEQR